MDPTKRSGTTRNESSLSTEEQLALAIEALSEHVVLFDADDRVVLANKAWRELNKDVAEFTKIGTRFEDHLRALIEKGLAPGASGREEAWLRERMERHLNPCGSFEVARQDGRWIRVYEQRLPNGGIILIISDITDTKRADEALRESEARFRAVVNNSPAKIHIKDEDGRYILINSLAGELFGITDEKARGKTTHEIFPKEQADAFAAHDQSVFETGEAVEEQEEWLREDGVHTYLTVKFPIVDSAEKITGVGAIGTDITDRRRTEEALQEREQRLRGVLDNLAEGVITITTNGVIESVNPAAEHMFGYSAAEVIGQAVNILMPESDRSEHDAYIEHFLKAGQGKIVGTGPREVTAQRKDGSQFSMELAISDMVLGDQLYFIGTVRNITDRKRIEEALRESRDHIRLITDNLPAGISYFDSEQRYRFVNRTLEEWYDRPAEEILGRTIAEILGKEVQDRIGPSVDATIKGKAQNFEHIVTHPDGKTRTIYVEYVPHIDGTKKPQGCFAMVHDITERKRTEEVLLAGEQALQERIADLEEAQRKLEMQGESMVRLADDLLVARDEARAADRAKSEFLAAMSHELRTPLNAVLGFSEIIKDESLGPVGSAQYRGYAEDIHDSGKHLLGLINDILDLSKIESGTDDLHEDEIEIPEIIRSALKLVEQRAKQGATKLQIEIAGQLPPLRADKRKLKQILVNLLSNAIKFSDSGGEVALWAWCPMGSGHVFQIIDTGIGIAPEDIPKALSRFGQIDGDLNRQYEGTGLGLPLTKALIELHGGTLDVQSHVGVGTIITVRFPVERIVCSPHDDKAASEAPNKVG